MDTNHAIVTQDKHILVIKLNRPEKRNALSPGMLMTVYDAWQELKSNDDLRCAVITCLLYTSPSPRDATLSRMPSSA